VALHLLPLFGAGIRKEPIVLFPLPAEKLSVAVSGCEKEGSPLTRRDSCFFLSFIIGMGELVLFSSLQRPTEKEQQESYFFFFLSLKNRRRVGGFIL